MVAYEWTVETLDGPEDDIVDNDFFDRFREALSRAAALRAEGKRVEIGLVRSVWNNLDGDLEDRQWAYLEDGLLPTQFDGGAIIPKRFFIEVKKAQEVKL